MARYRIMMELLFGVEILFQGCASEVKCIDDNGQAVDWYIIYTYPNRKDGLSYLYMDESTNGWKVSNEAINSKSVFLANTLRPLLDFYDRKTEDFGYMLYNDQPPRIKPAQKTYPAPSSFGHSKGVVMLDKKTGVWLSHSTPQFPKYRSKDFWPNSGNINAQTFMCVTYSYEEFKEIGLQLKYIHAYSYDHDIPTTFHNELRCVAKRDCYPKNEPWFSAKTLTSMSRRKFLSLAKYTRFGDDLYSGLLVNYFKSNLYVKTWGKMRDPLSSNCSSSIPHHVYDVKEVKLPYRKHFFDTVDHSKWCVTNGDWTCIADMNRETSQMKRGGGAICIKDITVARAFRKIIKSPILCKIVPKVPGRRSKSAEL